MRTTLLSVATVALLAVSIHGRQPAAPLATPDPIRPLIGRLELEKYKATVKGLTQFGDRRQGTQRNRDAVDWIQKQLESYGYTNAARIEYDPPVPTRECGPSVPASVVVAAPPRAGGAGAAGAGRGNANAGRGFATGPGGSRQVGNIASTGVNCDPMAQPDERIRALDSGPFINKPVHDVYVTKIGTKYPNEMYIIGGHMDGIGWGQAVNDDASGSAIVMELARIFSMPDVQTERSIRFALWNNEETGLNGARAYAEQRAPMQGKEVPPGSGKYPEPKWLGMIQHDMMMFDHGMPRADGTMNPEQRLEADVNIEFQSNSKMAAESQKLAWFLATANEKYATDYPAAVGQHMTNTDSAPFQDLIPAISLRENERGAQIGAGWDPQWHQPTDLFSTYSDKDFRLGLNAAQTTLSAVALLAGARLSR